MGRAKLMLPVLHGKISLIFPLELAQKSVHTVGEGNNRFGEGRETFTSRPNGTTSTLQKKRARIALKKTTLWKGKKAKVEKEVNLLSNGLPNSRLMSHLRGGSSL